MTSPRFAHALFFDDIRQEVGNKLSLMGMYVTDLVIPVSPPPGVPVILPRFFVCTWLRCDWGDDPEWITVRLYGPPGRTEIAKSEIRRDTKVPPIQVFENPKTLSFFVTMPFAPFIIPEEGEIAVGVETEQGEISGGRIKVIFQKNSPLEEEQIQPDLQALPKNRRKK